MPNRVRTDRSAEKCRALEVWHSAHPHAHQDAMRRLIGRDTVAVARETGLARRTLQSWRDLDEEHRGPGEVLETAMVAALRLGRPVEDATSPVRVLADAFGFDLVERVSAADQLCADRATSELMRRAGSSLEVLTSALADRRVTLDELPSIVEELALLQQAVGNALDAARRAAATEADRLRQLSHLPLRGVAS